MAFARGCELALSSAAARAINSSSFTVFVNTSVTFGLPSVIVPVLSRTTVSILCATSRLAAVLISMPFSAPLPVPAIIAAGVARPRAQGQDITRTATAILSAKEKSPFIISHTKRVIKAIPSTAGTNTPLILSASLEIGALEPAASSTSEIIL